MESKSKSKFKKWFLPLRDERLAGAKELSSFISTDFKSQKKQILLDGEIIYTYGSSDSIEEHFSALKQEFSGKSELCYTHAKIIVLIRRNFEVKKHFSIFEELWSKEEKFLLKNLNTRWLLSAADTFTDYSDDDALRGLSMACSCLLNTVNIQESERFITNAKDNKDDQEKISRLDNKERITSFDGIAVFKFGTADDLKNMRNRINKVAKINIAGKILLEVFERLQNLNTTYRRAKERHIKSETSWW